MDRFEIEHILQYVSLLPRYARVCRLWQKASVRLFLDAMILLDKMYPRWRETTEDHLEMIAMDISETHPCDLFLLIIHYHRGETILWGMEIAHMYNRQDIVHRLLRVYKPVEFYSAPIVVHNLYRYKHKDRKKYMRVMLDQYKDRLEYLVPFMTKGLYADILSELKIARRSQIGKLLSLHLSRIEYISNAEECIYHILGRRSYDLDDIRMIIRVILHMRYITPYLLFLEKYLSSHYKINIK